MSTFSLRARWVLPVDGPLLSDGVVSVSDGIITSVDKYTGTSPNLQDLGDVILMPGLVNAHTHLEFSDCRRPLGKPKLPLTDWIRLVIANRKRNDRSAESAIQAGLAECLQHGVTSLGEISTAQPAAYDGFQGASLVAFEEVIGFSASRMESILDDVGKRLDRSRALNPRCLVGISPHAPYTVHPELLKRLVALAREYSLPIAMHLAESRQELELLSTGCGAFRELLEERSMWDSNAIPQNSTPLDYLRILADAPRALVIHGNYLTEGEIYYLGEHSDRMSVVYCPRTHAYFGHDTYPLESMLTAGVKVAIGTDSQASNPDLNLLSELRWISRQFPNVSPDTILRLGTLSGAEALGLAQETGSLSPGKWADMIAIPCPEMSVPYEKLLSSNTGPDSIWIRGVCQRRSY